MDVADKEKTIPYAKNLEDIGSEELDTDNQKGESDSENGLNPVDY